MKNLVKNIFRLLFSPKGRISRSVYNTTLIFLVLPIFLLPYLGILVDIYPGNLDDNIYLICIII